MEPFLDWNECLVSGRVVFCVVVFLYSCLLVSALSSSDCVALWGWIGDNIVSCVEYVLAWS